ncbi:MAG TPA: cytosine permease [Candidatus Eisenbacteria bacterium]|nr:cytosine permease [Candidatus Eisenbacteria bacterium]
MEKDKSKLENQQVVDIDYSLERVPKTARKKFWSMFVIMLGFTYFSASMSVGAKMANGLDLSMFIWAVLIGGVILGAYTGALGYIACDTGMSLDLLTHRSFGTIGSFLPSALISFTQIGWFGVGAAMFAVPVAELFDISPWILVIAIGILMTGSAYFGIKGLEIVSFISVPLITILGTYSMVRATADGGGLVAIFDKSTGSLSLVAAIGMVIGSFVSGGTATPNFARFAKNKKTAVITTVIAFFIGNTLMFAFGAVGGAFTGQEDIFYVMIAQGLTIPAILVLGANIWTTNDNALYTGGLGLSNITKIRKRPMVIVSGIIGTATALWLYYNFVSWLGFLNATLPPVGAIIILDYILRKEAYKKDADDKLRKVNWFALIGVVVGAIVGNFVPWGISAINAMVAAGLVYFIGSKLFYKK